MRIAPNYRCYGPALWSAGLLSFLLLPGSLWGQQIPASHDDGFATAFATDSGVMEPLNQNPIGFVPNWKLLLAQFATGAGDNDPRKRFVVSYEQMLFGMSPLPAAGTIATRSEHAAPQTMSPAMMPVSAGNTKSFSATALENLGTGAIGSLVPNLGTGSRMEFGRMETDSTGWAVSFLDLNNSGPNAQSPDGNHAARSR